MKPRVLKILSDDYRVSQRTPSVAAEIMRRISGPALATNRLVTSATAIFQTRSQCRWYLAILIILCAAQMSLLAEETNRVGHSPGELNPGDLKEKSLKELMEVMVTSVSKKAEKLSEAASAITVITQEDIRRSGATSLPEALRLAPNLEVAQVDSHEWAISARGFNSTTANNLRVLIAGRSVYTRLFSGVFWDVQDT